MIDKFFGFLEKARGSHDVHMRKCSTKRVLDTMWSRVQNITYISSELHEFGYSDTFVFSAMIEFYSSKVFDTVLESGVTFSDALDKIEFYRRVVYNEKREAMELTSREEHKMNCTFRRFNESVGEMCNENRCVSHNCVIGVECNKIYTRMSLLGMNAVDVTNLIILMAAVDCDNYLSAKNNETYGVIIKSFFDGVNELFEYVINELDSEVCDDCVCHIDDHYEKVGIPNKGKNHSNWKGGISFEPYCPKFNDAFKESIREKFGRVCFLCGKSEEDNGRKLSVHHVNYDKGCGCNDKKCEFVPLCSKCHPMTNGNREMWERLIMNVLSYEGWI